MEEEEEGRRKGPKEKRRNDKKTDTRNFAKIRPNFFTIWHNLFGRNIYIKQNCLFVMSVIFNSIPKRLCSRKKGRELGRERREKGGREKGGRNYVEGGREGPMTRNFA